MCLSCTGTGERVCLSAEGFGNRQCFLESIVDKVCRSKEDLFKFPIFIIFLFQNVPPDLSQCVFVIEQALSVRALQEIISSNDAEAVRKKNISELKLQFDNLLIFLYPAINILIFQGKGLGSGHKTLLYGNAILLRHCNSDMVRQQTLI